MYAGPGGHVDPDEYLTGRAVDKTFEQFKLGGAQVDSDLPAPTLPRQKATVPSMQVDVVRKVQEDPLLRIRRVAEEKKAQLLEQAKIRQRLSGVSGKSLSGKRQADDDVLDEQLASKLKSLRKRDEPSSKDKALDEKIAEKLRKLKEKERRHSPPRLDRRRDRSPPRHSSNSRPKPPPPRKPAALSADEIEKRRREMMDQAVVRDHERKQTVDKYRKEMEAEDKQLNSSRPKEADFVK